MKTLTESLPFEMLWQDRIVPLEHYLRLKADQLTEKYAKDGVFFSNEDVRKYLNICKEGQEMDDDADAWLYDSVESCCKDLAATTATVLHGNDLATSEALIIESSRTITLDNGYDRLKEFFDFGTEFNQLIPKENAGAKEYAEAFCYFSQMANKGAFGMAKAAMALNDRFGAKGENILIQLAGDLGISEQTLRNAIRTEQRIPINSKCRELLPPTVIQEILLPKYPGTAEEVEKLREELISRAINEKWNSQEAREHAKSHKVVQPVEAEPDPSYRDRFLCVELATGALWASHMEPEAKEGVVIVELSTMTYRAKNGEFDAWLDVPVK